MRAATSIITTAIAGLLVSAAPAAGRAQEPASRLTPLGAYALLGGGVTDFSKRELRDRFDTGGSWDARIGVGSRSYVGAEAAYVGSYRSLKGLDAHLAMNGAEGVVRIQLPVTSGPWLVEPFAFGGIGWSHLSLRSAPAGVRDSQDIGTVPFGAGVTLGYARFLLDARFTYRSTFHDTVDVAPGAASSDLSHWTAGASVGLEF